MYSPTYYYDKHGTWSLQQVYTAWLIIYIFLQELQYILCRYRS